MKIILLGEDSFSAHVLTSLIVEGHAVQAVFCPTYQNNIHARLQLICTKNTIPFYRVTNINLKEYEEIIRKLNPDVILVCHFQQILKKNIIQIPVKGCINLHPALLPKYRGLSPQHWPIINGDKETGITVHFVNEGIDSGDIIVQHKISLDPHSYVSDVQLKMIGAYQQIVSKALELVDQKDFTPTPQNIEERSYFGKLTDEQCQIALHRGCINAYNLIRGVSKPYLGAQLDGYRIWKAQIAPDDIHKGISSEYPENGFHVDDTLGAFIKFNDGSLFVTKYDPCPINYDKTECYA